jgi:predicted RNA-binding protein with PUA-like domain
MPKPPTPLAYWLIKSEPYKFSWSDLNRLGQDHWDGIRNFQARNNLKAMKQGDICLFYHSNEGKEIVGLCHVVTEHYPDPTFTPEVGKENPWVVVDVAPLKPFNRPVTLAEIKATPALAEISLLKQMRLSVAPITPAEFKCLLKMGNTTL